MATKNIEIELPNWLDGVAAEAWRIYPARLEEGGYSAGAAVIRSLTKALEREEKRRFIQPEELRDGQVVRVTEETTTTGRKRITEGEVTRAGVEGRRPMIGGWSVQVAPTNANTNVTIELLEDAPEPEFRTIYVATDYWEAFTLISEANVSAADSFYAYETRTLEGQRAGEIVVALGATVSPYWERMLEVLEAIAAKNGAPIRVVQDIVAEAKAKVAA